jgi:thiol:disulfide interchange protein
VYGVPTVLLFDHTGQERSELRLLGFVSPSEFLKRLEQLR